MSQRKTTEELVAQTPAIPPGPDEDAPPAEPPAPGTPAQEEEEATAEEPGAEDEAMPAFDLEAFVKSLPEGVCLCPMCLGLGGVVEDPPFDPHAHLCTTCQGHGRVRTGSLVSDKAERPCLDCKGAGYLSNRPEEPAALPASAARLAEPEPRDHAGRTPDDPDFDWTRVVVSSEPPAAAETAAELDVVA